MSKIKIISASAGTGKTHRLAEELYNHIVSGAARPEAILATTFTNKAADELLSRIRRRLLQDGKVAEAHRLGAARIGTVNSVCSRLVSDFAFELGLSPDLHTLDENTANAAIRRAMSEVVTEVEANELSELEERFGIGRKDRGWQSTIETIVARARSNALTAKNLAKCADRSIAGFGALLGKPAKDGKALDKALQKALEMFLSHVEEDGIKKTDTALNLARQMNSGKTLPWPSWAKLANGLDPAKQWQDDAEKVRVVARQHDSHPRLREDCERMIRLIFTIAARTLDAYQVHKAAWGSIDFVDQEVLAMQALNMKDVFERLSGELDLVLVDEFQDTNPIQLALFLKLADAAKESIWVGDQKQAIYGFRGTDPALMDAALAAIEAGSGPMDVLKHSWRSRPELVKLTSEIFAPPFARTGIPPERVRIGPSPKKATEPAGLGPIVERWNLPTKNQADDATAVAAALKEMVSDKTVKVWDKTSGLPRPVEAGDVAVLCFHNFACANVAAALAALGIPVELAQSGLMATAEGRLAFAALRLWVDTRDALAAAELARIIEYPDNGNDWLDAIMAKPGIAAFESLPVIVKIRAAKEANPAAGAVAALDFIMEAIGIRNMCLRWGDADIRLGNLEALRGHAVGYVAVCAAEGAGCTPAGLIAYLGELKAEDQDMRATLAGKNAVRVSTWHAAKGREWPITVIYELDGPPDVNALGIQLVSDATQFDIRNPLADRWLRYWPSPYGKISKTAFHERLAQHPTSLKAIEDAQRQNLRLLYVVWTRARDRLILAAREGKINQGVTALLTRHNRSQEEDFEQKHAEHAKPVRQAHGRSPAASTPQAQQIFPSRSSRASVQISFSSDHDHDAIDSSRKELIDKSGELLLIEPSSDTVTWAGKTFKVKIRTAAPIEPSPAKRVPGEWVEWPSKLPEYPPEYVQPSAINAKGKVGTVIEIGPRFLVSGQPEMDIVGNAIHGFLAADRPDLTPAQRMAIASGLLTRWDIASSVDPKDLVNAGTSFRDWVDQTWPGAKWHREWPLRMRMNDGSILRGIADLVLETSTGYVVIDHKSFPGGRERAIEKAAGYVGQLMAYAEAIRTATGKPVVGFFIHMPLVGIVLPIECINRQ